MSCASNTPVDACTCPLCGKPNACAMEASKQTGQPLGICWCVNVAFSAELLARVPEATQKKACICQACATSSSQ